MAVYVLFAGANQEMLESRENGRERWATASVRGRKDQAWERGVQGAMRRLSVKR